MGWYPNPAHQHLLYYASVILVSDFRAPGSSCCPMIPELLLLAFGTALLLVEIVAASVSAESYAAVLAIASLAWVLSAASFGRALRVQAKLNRRSELTAARPDRGRVARKSLACLGLVAGVAIQLSVVARLAQTTRPSAEWRVFIQGPEGSIQANEVVFGEDRYVIEPGSDGRCRVLLYGNPIGSVVLVGTEWVGGPSHVARALTRANAVIDGCVLPPAATP